MAHKTDLINNVANSTGISKKDTGIVLEAVLEEISKSLQKGDKVTLIGFGTFEAKKRKARTGRNPRTGETIKIPATNTVKFSPGKKLKEEVK